MLLVLLTFSRLRMRSSRELLSALLQLSHETALTHGVGRFPWGAPSCGQATDGCAGPAGELEDLALASAPGLGVAYQLCQPAGHVDLGRCSSEHDRPIRAPHSLGLLMATARLG
jgi:hypothetical protein